MVATAIHNGVKGVHVSDFETDHLRSQLRVFHEAIPRNIREQWNLDLPLPELLVDRWERARTLGFGAESSVYDACYVYGEVQVGEHTWVGPFTILDGTGRIRIGRYCSISAGVHIYSHDTVRW